MADKDKTITLSKTELQLIIRAELQHHCKFEQINPEDMEPLGRYCNMVSSLGGGEIDEGIAVMRENHKWLKAQRDRSGKMATAFLVCLVTTSTAGLLSFIWKVVKGFIG